ncbi:MAG: tetratricopeptide repeat protein, partial [Variibacter sp.]|nr:tetratricopeptide repeat protein [Variibacter sp.]
MIRIGTCAALVALALMGTAVPAAAQSAPADRALKDCMNLPDPDQNIRDCTTVIEQGEAQSARNRAIAYLNRAIAYLQKNDSARALPDLDAAIALD